ncbi:MAG: hypothetical protein QF441_15515 [Bacteriovoracaceae bacterium]|jgi:hypothetical protein|nr:hypothetical protein [Bacteriovoracaceae bacterium]
MNKEMIDKLKLTTNSPENMKYLFLNLKKLFPNYRKTPERFYNETFQFFNKSTYITLSTKPIHSNMAQLTIEFNPTKFNSKKELDLLLHDISSYTLSRIDHKADIDFNFHDFINKVRVLHKNKRSDYQYKSRLTGVEYGKGKEVLCIYDKAFEKQKKNYKLIKNINEIGSSSRVELRQYHHKIPFRNYLDLEEYLNFNPFEKIQTLDIKDDLLEKEVLSYYLNVSSTLQGLIRSLSKSNNFPKLKDKYFIENNLKQDLLNNYHEGLSKFLDS